VFEFGCQNPTHLQMGMGTYDETVKRASWGAGIDSIDFSLAFHSYSVEWDAFFINYKIDGNQVMQVSKFYTLAGNQVTWCCLDAGVYNILPAFPVGQNCHVNIIAGMAIGVDGGPFTDAPNGNTILPNHFEIDYIRVYQREPPSSEINTCAITLFPNPVNSTITIRKIKMKFISVKNILGQEIYSLNVNADDAVIDVSGFQRGIYFVEVYSDDGVMAGKFIKQ
jgi:beta-glucanase (GH16 family)